jgi:hypothetical protein
MTDLTADLQSLGIPTLDHKTYVMKVFFPGVTDHPILNDPKVNKTTETTNFFLLLNIQVWQIKIERENRKGKEVEAQEIIKQIAVVAKKTRKWLTGYV